MMAQEEPVHSLEELLDRLCGTASDKEEINVGQMLTAAGRRSFGALLLLPGVIVLSPLSGIPGLPSTMAVLIVLIAVQLLIGKHHFWLPQWVLSRHASRQKLQKAVRFLRPVARFGDRLTRERFTLLTRGPAVYVIALACIAIAATMPVMELVPFANSAAGAAVTVLALALVSHDGLLAAIAIALSLGAMAWTIGRVMG